MGELIHLISAHHNIIQKMISNDKVNLTNKELNIYGLVQRLPHTKYEILVEYL